MVLEALLVVIKFLQYIVDPNSKFGKFLSRLLKGIKYVQDEAKNASNKIEKEQSIGKGQDDGGSDENSPT